MQAVGVDRPVARRRRRSCRSRRSRPPSTREVGADAVAGAERAADQDPRHAAPLLPRARRTARPSAPRCRSPPARARSSAASPRPRRRSRGPRFIGPGCMTRLRSGQPGRPGDRQPVERRVLLALGKKASVIRSRCTRSIMTTSGPASIASSRSMPAVTGQPPMAPGSSVGGADEPHGGAEGGEQPDVRARDARVQHVADDHDRDAVEVPAARRRRRAAACGS